MKKVIGLFLALAAIASFAFVKPNAPVAKQINVVIDAGHGGKDFGMTVNDYTEKQIVEEVTNRIMSLNNNKNIVLHFTRIDDQFISLEERINFINSLKPDLVLSLHINGNKNTTASGMEFYVCKDNVGYEKSRLLATRLEEKFTKNNSFISRGVKDAQFMILKKSEAPAITVELGFLSNENDKKYLTDKSSQDNIANTVLELISEIK
jgi:N-acetylmuramoyl-L-alanine amidase